MIGTPLPSLGYFVRKLFMIIHLTTCSGCKILILIGLAAKYYKQTGYLFEVKGKEPRIVSGALSCAVVHYSGLGITFTPREFTGLARVLGVEGLDRVFDSARG